MADLRKHSSTSNIFRFLLKNSSTGQGLTGLAFNSSGLIISTVCDNEASATAYTAAGSTIETITTLGTFATPTATKCRFKEVDATNHKGLYEFQFADARFSVANAKRLVISVSGATNLLEANYEVQLTQADVYDATSLGLSRLDAAITSRMATFTLPTNFSAFTLDASGRVQVQSGTSTGQISLSSGIVSANVTQFGGTNGTFSGGRPEVNATHLAGTAYASADLSTTMKNSVNAQADIALTDYDGGNGVASLSNQVTINTGVDTILLRIGAFAGSGVNTILGFLRALMRKDGSITTPSDVGGTYDHTTDSNEALRDRGDAAWTTATGFSTLDAAGVRAAVGLSSANLDTQLSTIDTVVDAVKLKTDNLPADPADASDIAAAIAALNDLAASEVWDLTDGVEAGETPRQTLRLLRAILVGLLERTAGTSATGTVEFKRKNGTTVAATVDYDAGERTAVTIGTLT